MQEILLVQKNVENYARRKEELIKKIDRLITFAQDPAIRRKILDSRVENLTLDDVTQHVLEIKNKLLEDKVKISVLAEVSNGKSTFLNALIFRDRVLDARIGETTGRCYRITYGDEYSLFSDGKRFVFKSLDELKEKIKELNKSAFSVLKTLNVDVQQFDVIITIPHEMLRKGIEVIDTPGFGTMNEEHLYNLISYAVETSDAVIILLDVSQSIKKSEAEKFAQLLKAIRPDKRYIIFNKIDGYEHEWGNFENVKRKAIEEMMEILKKQGYSDDTMDESKQIFFVSAKKALEAFKDGNGKKSSDRYLEIFKKMEESLWNQLIELKEKEFLNVKEKAFIKLLSSKFHEFKTNYERMKSLVENLRKEKHTLEQNKDAIKRMAQDLQSYARKIIEDLRRLQIIKSDLLTALTEKVIEKSSVNKIIDEKFPNKDEISKALEHSLYSLSIAEILEETLNEKYGEIRKNIRESIAKYNQKVEEYNEVLRQLQTTSLEFPKIEFSNDFLAQSMQLSPKLQQEDAIEYLLGEDLPVYAASFAGAFSWAKLGGFLGFLIATVVYIVLDLWLSHFVEKKKEELKMKFKEEVYSQLDNQAVFEAIVDTNNSNIMVVSSKVKEVEAISQLIIENLSNTDLERVLEQEQSKLSNIEYVYGKFQEVFEYVTREA